MGFIKEIITAGSGTSSKRVISLVSLILFTAVVIAALFKVFIPDVYIISLVSLIAGNQALTLFQQGSINGKKVEDSEPDERF